MKRETAKAAALKFDAENDLAPRVTAKGEGSFATEIIALAKKSGTPVVENSPVASTLMQIRVGEEIPENLYRAVSVIFGFIYSKRD